MAENRKVIDCRWLLDDIPCDIAISGNEEAELNRAMQYAVESHGVRDTPALRERLRSLLRDESKRRIAGGAMSDPVQ
jgi:hypothetical protein